MTRFERPPSPPTPTESNGLAQIMLIVFGLAAPIGTFAIAVSPLSADAKIYLLVAVSLVYLAICFWAFFQLRRIRLAALSPFHDFQGEAESDLETKLAALEDANQFFGTSLKPADMFRLVASRVGEIVSFAACSLIVKDDSGVNLRIVQATGTGGEQLANAEITKEGGIAGLAFLSREIEIAANLRPEEHFYPPDRLKGFVSAVAIPMFHNDEVFAVFQLYLDKVIEIDKAITEKLDAISERVAPLFLGSMAFERSLSNALTDSLTNLPNERAFYMVLENQLAESQRFREDRPLTLLTIDIKNFEEINQNYGHAAGDRILSFAATLIGAELRKMDFLARSMNDEFIGILPTASEKTAHEIIARIQTSFVNTPFAISESESIKVWLNFGWATFWKDGETAQQLVQNAQLRKQQAKSEEPSKVLWFPKEYVN